MLFKKKKLCPFLCLSSKWVLTSKGENLLGEREGYFLYEQTAFRRGGSGGGANRKSQLFFFGRETWRCVHLPLYELSMLCPPCFISKINQVYAGQHLPGQLLKYTRFNYCQCMGEVPYIVHVQRLVKTCALECIKDGIEVPQSYIRMIFFVVIWPPLPVHNR